MAHGRRLPGNACILALLVLVLQPSPPVSAAEAPCSPPADVPPVLATPDDQRAATLPTPFQSSPWPVDREQLLADTQQRVLAQLRAIDAPRCYLRLVPTIAARTAVLSPLEFLAVAHYDRDWTTRDA